MTAAGAVVVLGALSALSGCAAGFGAASSRPYAPSDGVQAESGDLKVLNALVVASGAGTTGLVSTTIANTGDRDDRLTGLTSPDGTVELTGSPDLPAGAAVLLGAGTDLTATVSGLSRRAGETVTLEISFSRAEPVTLHTVVVAATGIYAELTPPPSTSPSPSPVGSASPSASPSASAS